MLKIICLIQNVLRGLTLVAVAVDRSSDVAKNTGSLSKFVLTLTRPWLMRRKIISNSMRKVGL